MLPDSKRFNLGYIAARTAAVAPERTAVVDLHGGAERVVTYGELDRRLDRMAAALKGLGLPPGERVALLVGNRYEYIESSFGAMRAGLVPVMVNTKLGLAGIAASIEEVGAAVAIVDPAVNPAALEASATVRHRILLGGGSGGIDYDAMLAAAPDGFEPPALSSNSVAELCFTSGSTGRPKAVMLSHRAMLLKHYLYGNHIRLATGEPVRALVSLPIFHGNGRLSTAIAWETGGHVVIQPQFEPRAVLQNLARYRINYILCVAPAYVAMLRETDLLESLDFSALRYPLIGSAPAGGDIVDRVRDSMGVRLMHTYGSTEGGVVLQHPVHEICEPHSCGRALPGNELKLIDPATGREGDSGELWIRNEFTSEGYWGRPELTEAKFIGGWYASGDLFERNAVGHYYFRGRTDDMFNVGGEKVYPAEVEGLLQRHPKVLGASVVAVTHASKGEVPAAMVVLVAGASATADELKAFCLEHGPAYAHPRAIQFVEAFPLSGAGKVDRVRVREMLSALPV